MCLLIWVIDSISVLNVMVIFVVFAIVFCLLACYFFYSLSVEKQNLNNEKYSLNILAPTPSGFSH